MTYLKGITCGPPNLEYIFTEEVEKDAISEVLKVFDKS